jgi:hypothetical protein
MMVEAESTCCYFLNVYYDSLTVSLSSHARNALTKKTFPTPSTTTTLKFSAMYCIVEFSQHAFRSNPYHYNY